MALLVHCASAPGKVTQACWDAAGLGDVEIEAYPYQTYAYHDKGTTPVFEGTYLVFNNGDNPVNIEYGMAYFGLNPGAPSEPGGLVVKEGEGLTPTRLKEIVQGLQRPILIPKATDSLDIPGQRKKEIRPVEERASSVERTSKSLRVAGSKAERVEGTWTRYALAMGNEVANNGYNWWSNAGATYEGGNLVASFLSGDLYIKLRTACPQTTEEGLLFVTSDCWKQDELIHSVYEDLRIDFFNLHFGHV
ncbi:hypothetical protein NGA_0119500, partial [Nannochloropsis gaditana CCMP526]|uniref:uncharacterized protein n=1 Tax=Nannochloropsis gaditana (strain CCMP526) TaxID=1093141 RepID=UPI00029F75A3